MNKSDQSKTPVRVDDWSNHWQSFAKSASENPAQKMRHKIVLDKLLKLNILPKVLIDIGSGQGDFLAKAIKSKVANEYYGFELSESGVVISKSKVPEAIFFQVDLFNPSEVVLEFKNKADAIVCIDVIEHLDDPELFCKNIKKYLKSEGYLFLSVPSGPISKFDKFIGHRTHFKKAKITNLLSNAGFDVEKVNMVGFPFFNLYRMMVILRGGKLINDAEEASGENSQKKLLSFFMWAFDILFKLNINSLPLGWQVVAIAKNNDKKEN